VWPLIDEEAKRGEFWCGAEYSEVSSVLIRDYTVVSSGTLVRLFTAVSISFMRGRAIRCVAMNKWHPLGCGEYDTSGSIAFCWRAIRFFFGCLC